MRGALSLASLFYLQTHTHAGARIFALLTLTSDAGLFTRLIYEVRAERTPMWSVSRSLDKQYVAYRGDNVPKRLASSILSRRDRFQTFY